MYEILSMAPPDPILGLTVAFREDPRPEKINLGVGVYEDAYGKTPKLKCVDEAERRLLAGPSTLDRLVALDTLVAVTMCGVGAWAAYSLDTTVTYGLAALALMSFVGSVSVARFRVPDTMKPRATRRSR